jgi:hypothetical protein
MEGSARGVQIIRGLQDRLRHSTERTVAPTVPLDDWDASEDARADCRWWNRRRRRSACHLLRIRVAVSPIEHAYCPGVRWPEQVQ